MAPTLIASVSLLRHWPTESSVSSRQFAGRLTLLPTLRSSFVIRNHLLRLLPPAELARFRNWLEPVRLTVKDVLIQPDAEVENLFFVERGTVSMIATLKDGSRVEVGLVGPEGLVGLPLVLGCGNSAIEAMVQSEGLALRLPAARLRVALAEAPALQGLLLRYVDSFSAQVAQTAACNARHQIEQRLARWLLMTNDRVEDDKFVMTQEFMSTMLGVRRPGVTEAIGALRRAGLIEHKSGTLTVLDRAGLEAASCDCYAAVRDRFEWLYPERAEAAPRWARD